MYSVVASFETVARALVEQMNFSVLKVPGEDVALLAKRVSFVILKRSSMIILGFFLMPDLGKLQDSI